ncbi:MAG: DUF429 domain-containing protein [Acidobacteriota bacterium]|nr:DUF429 domain-containing protein [Acidobacteriota bacterium]
MSATTRFLGVDLAVRATNTGLALLEINDRRAHASWPEVTASDEELVRLVDAATVVGLDAPLGWPTEFVELVRRHGDFSGPDTWDVSRLRYRATDRFVAQLTGRAPLSVSADLIGAVAMRAAGLQTRWATAWGAAQPRDGSGRLVEVYPRAALWAWALRPSGAPYKGATNVERRRATRDARAAILAQLTDRAPWLSFSAELHEQCVNSDDVLDALVSALVAWAASRGQTHRVATQEYDLNLVRREGWIHVPSRPLEELDPARD